MHIAAPFQDSAMILKYPPAALIGDYVRSVLGFGVSLSILVSLEPGNRMLWLFAGILTLFLFYLLRTILKQTTRIALSRGSLSSGPWPMRALDWGQLQGMTLRYYAPRLRGANRRQEHDDAAAHTARAVRDGWMILQLRGRGSKEKIAIESSLPHFSTIVARASAEAALRGLALDPITKDNLEALGRYSPDMETKPPQT